MKRNSSHRFDNLDVPWRELIRKMQQINFGRIESLPFHDGLPDLDSNYRTIREIKFGGDNQPRPEIALDDFPLVDAHMQLITELGRRGDGIVESITVKHGLPFLLELEN